ncbi:MAG: hypothetical protein FWG40_01035 [Peptococcaceae bacterium]|nr:hypothetical protein [Peptococcaceae bacterium]
MKLKRSQARIIVISSLCMALTGFGTLYATNYSELKDQSRGENSQLNTLVPVEDGRYSDTIYFHGQVDSKEYQAAKEWKIFLDQNMSRLMNNASISNEPTEEIYTGVYTPEMVEKMEELASKYELKLHDSMQHFYNKEDLYKMAGKESFLGSITNVEGGYIYNNGTFQYDGGATLSNGVSFAYQLGYYQKGYFDSVYLEIGDIEDYSEIIFHAANGVIANIATSKNKSLIFADLGSAFVTINILPELNADFKYQQSNEISSDNIEAFIASFDFSML